MTRAPKVTISRADGEVRIISSVKHDLAKQLQHLLDTAWDCGFVIDVRLEPLKPLAMGHYRMLGHIRSAK